MLHPGATHRGALQQVMRGLAVHSAKKLYIVQDAAREGRLCGFNLGIILIH
jgi:hypothetical protein